MARYEVSITRKALKELNGLDERSKNRVLKALVILRDYGFSSRLDIKKLRGYRNHYRIRVGDYRILFELVKPRKVIVYAILPRKKAFKKK